MASGGVLREGTHLDVQLITSVVRLEALDLLDGLGEAHRKIEQDVTLVSGRSRPSEIADMSCGGGGPVYDDVEGEEDTAEGIEPPHFSIVSNLCMLAAISENVAK